MNQQILNLTLLRERILTLYGTQSAFAQHQGWSKQYLSRVLTGKANLSLSRAAELANALGVPLSDLVAENPPPAIQPANGRRLRESTALYEVPTFPGEFAEPEFKMPPAPAKLSMKMTPELDALIREHPKMEPLRAVIADGRPWSELTLEERRERVQSTRGIFRWLKGSVDEFLARKHAETAEEERKYAIRS